MTGLTKGNSITFSVDICIEEDGDSFYAYCPALKGIHIDGSTEKKALKNTKVAIKLYIESLLKHGDAIPLRIVEGPAYQPSCTACSSRQRHTEDIRVAI